MSEVFKCKQFEVNQAGAAMKIGTDAILLGAWTSLDHTSDSILDIGAGTGILSLQMAQRSTAQIIDAVEIDDQAFEQCTENFEASPWGDRLYCYHASIQEYASEIEEQYDLIVSNPPFFDAGTSTGDEARDQARFTDALPFNHLIICAAHLLSESGVFALIIPKDSEEEILSIAQESGLFPKRICHVKGRSGVEPKRSLVEFTFKEVVPKMEELTIEVARHEYTPEYQALVKDFYLKM